MNTNAHLTRRLTVVAASGASALALAAPALADRDWLPGGNEPFPVPTLSVRPDDRAVRPGLPAAATSSVRPDDRAVRPGPPTAVAADDDVAVASPSNDKAGFDWGDAFGVALFLGALGLLAVLMLYSKGRPRHV